MKLYIFGTCAGTEPIQGRHHTALALEINNRIYWFDAGESCSYTAHLMGVDLLAVSDIFISHPHIDHVGGLGNLLWSARKLYRRSGKKPYFGDINVYMPNADLFKSFISILENGEGDFQSEYKINEKIITDSSLLKNNDIEVIAHHNLHLPQRQNTWESFSFCINAENKKIVYSADVSDIDDIKDFISDGCDILLVETGHHNSQEICKKIKEHNYPIAQLMFLHHGRAILADYDGELKRCQQIIPSVIFCNDGDVYDI